MTTPSGRKLGTQLSLIERRLRRLERGAATPQLDHSSLENGALRSRDRDGNLQAVIGRQPDGSHTITVVDGPTPLQPTDPVCEGGPLSVAVTWNGRLIGTFGEVDASLKTYADSEGCEVHVLDSESVDTSWESLGGVIGLRGGTISVPAHAGQVWVRLRLRAQSGKVGPPSPAVPVTVSDLVDTARFDQLELDLAELAIEVSDTGAELDQRLVQARADLDAAQAGINQARADLEALEDQTLPALAGQVDAARARLDTAFGEGATFDLGEALAGVEDRADGAIAQAAALAGQGVADAAAARSRADLAVTNAATADQAAREAAGLAGTKGETIVQLSAPTGSRAAAQNLWIRLPDNVPHRYNASESRWEAITDKTATDAASAAASARSVADTAQAAAAAAAQAAATAQETAEQTPRPHQSTSAPTTSNVMPAGTRWEQVDDAGRVVGIWVQQTAPTGGSWVTRALDLSILRASGAAIDDAVIENLTARIATILELSAEQITAGQIDAARLNVQALAAALADVIEARIENLTVTQGATIRTAVIEALWAQVVRSRKITTDMLLVGAGDNLIPDPHLADQGLTDGRLAASTGAWVAAVVDGERVASLPPSVGSPFWRWSAAPGLGDERYVPVTPGHVYRVRYEHRATGTAGVLPRVRPAIRYRRQGGSALTVYPRTSTVATGTSWAVDEVEWEAPADATSAYLEVAVTTSTGYRTVQLRRPSVTSKADASLLVDGAVAARHVQAESVAAALGEFLRIAANQITGGTINALLRLETQGALVVGDEAGVHIRIENGRIDVMRPGEDGAAQPYISMGRGTDGAFRVLDETGGVLGGIMPDGSYDGPEVRGNVLIQDGTPINDLISPRVWSLGTDRTPANVAYGPYGVDMPLWEGTFDLPPFHTLTLDVRGWMRGQGVAGLSLLRCSYVHTLDGALPPRPTGNSTELLPYAPVSYFTSSWTPVTWSWELGSGVAPARARLLVWISREGDVNPQATNFVFRPTLAQDRGASGFSGTVRARVGSTVPSDPVPAPPPPLVPRVQTFNLGPHALWINNGVRATQGYRLQDVQVGRSPSGTLHRTHILLPQAARSAISAAETLVSARVRLAASETPPSIRPHIGTITSAAITGATEPPSRNIDPGSRTYTDRGPSGWTELGSRTLAALAAGDPGLILTYASTSQTVGRFHGPDASGSLRPQIEITTRSRA